ncbi:MAG: molybdopterin molybdotransferase MoeA [Trueperaceae bacterium]
MEFRQDVSVADAIRMVVAAAPTPRTERLTVATALGRVLLEDVLSLVDHPNADDSALDGYACRFEDTREASTELPVRLRLRADAPAGKPWSGRLEPGEAVRIGTGGVVPDGADAVVGVEDTRLEHGAYAANGVALDAGAVARPTRDRTAEPLAEADDPFESERVFVLVHAPAHRSAVRPRAQDLREGEPYLRRGTSLNAAAVGLVVAMGHGTVRVARRPRVAIVTTGDEVVKPGKPLRRGQVYGSNGVAVAAMARAAGAEVVSLQHAHDDVTELAQALSAAGDVDLLVTSGGVSMGPRDVVRDLMLDAGEIAFWKVRVRPGGPTLFGRYRGVPLLGLPGNPVSSMVTFLLFGRPFLDTASGADAMPPYHQRVRATALTPFVATASKEVLARARMAEDRAGRTVHGFANQSSGVLRSMAEANALVLTPAGMAVRPGDEVDVIELTRYLR